MQNPSKAVRDVHSATPPGLTPAQFALPFDNHPEEPDVDEQGVAVSHKRTSRVLLAAGFDELRNRIRNGEVERRQLMTKGRMSYRKVNKELKVSNSVSSNSLLSDPKLFCAYHALKMACEGVVLSNSAVRAIYRNEIAEIQAICHLSPAIDSPTKLSRTNHALYCAVASTPYSATIFRYAGLTEGRHDYYYWDDGEIVEAAARFDSFTALKYGDGTLHKHVKGRRLMEAVVRANPEYARHFFVGHGGALYRSEPELIIGNYVYLNGVRCDREVDTMLNSNGSDKNRIADFYFPNVNLYLELVQNEAGDRGSRREGYRERDILKRDTYRRGNLACLFVNSDPFYRRGVFDVRGFAEHLRNQLLTHEVDIGALPNIADLLFREDTIKMRVLTEPPETIVSYLGSLGIDGIATLQNNFSHVLTCLQYRTDFADVMKRIKQAGYARRSECLRIRHAARRRDYAPLSVVKQFIQRHGIRTQIQWYRTSKEHRKELAAMNIPINLQSIYRQRGEWAGWTSLWPETGQQPALRVLRTCAAHA